MYYTFLFCILLRILMLHLDYSNLYFLSRVNFSNFNVHKSLCWPSVLSRVHDCQFSCFIAYQETVKVSKIIVKCFFWAWFLYLVSTDLFTLLPKCFYTVFFPTSQITFLLLHFQIICHKICTLSFLKK